MLVRSELVLYSAARLKRWYQTQASKKWSSCHSIYILVKQGNSQPIKGTRKRDKELIAVDLNTAHASAGHCKVKCRFMLLIALALGISGDVNVRGFFFFGFVPCAANSLPVLCTGVEKTYHIIFQSWKTEDYIGRYEYSPCDWFF